MVIDRDKIPVIKVTPDGSVTKQILRLGFGRRPSATCVTITPAASASPSTTPTITPCREDAHIHYIARVLPDNKTRAHDRPFDSSRDATSSPGVVIPLWHGSTWMGLEHAIASMQTGELAIVTIKRSALYCAGVSPSCTRPPYTFTATTNGASSSQPSPSPSSSSSATPTATAPVIDNWLPRLRPNGADIPTGVDFELELELLGVTDGKLETTHTAMSIDQRLAAAKAIKDEVVGHAHLHCFQFIYIIPVIPLSSE